MPPRLKGSQPWIAILCVPMDRAVPALPDPTYFRQFLADFGAGGIADFWLDMSGGRLDLSASRVVGWYVVGKRQAELKDMQRGEVAALARATAQAAGVVTVGYRHVLAVVYDRPDSGAVGSDFILGVQPWQGQPGWRHCRRCESLAFWDGTREPGLCSAGGRHDHSASSYYAVAHDSAVVDGQPGWRWCRVCEGLIFEGAQTSSPCAGGGTHDLAGFRYLLRNGSTDGGEQSGWRWCARCDGLAYSPDALTSGRCPGGGGVHDHQGSGNYSLPLAWAASVGLLAHETGHGFGLNHAFGTKRTGDFGNDRRPGAYGDWSDIMSWAGTASFNAARYTPAGAGLGAAMRINLGWVDPAAVRRIAVGSASETIALVPLGSAGAGAQAIQVVDGPNNRIFTASFRKATGWDLGLGHDRVLVHQQRSLFGAGQGGWLHCQRCNGMVYGAEMACAAGGMHDGTGSLDYRLSEGQGAIGQPGWRWCRRCSTLSFAGGGVTGPCPAGGLHDHTDSGNYGLNEDGPGQNGWRWCRRCQGLFFSENGVAGSCAAGGGHDATGSGRYTLHTQWHPAPGHNQDHWRWCGKCQGLFFAGGGGCVDGESHVLAGSEYALGLGLAGGQSHWKHCGKCQRLAFHDGTRPAGACSVGGAGSRHDHMSSGSYALHTDEEAAVGQDGWRSCRKCSALIHVGDGSRKMKCSAGGEHELPDSLTDYVLQMADQGVKVRSGFRWCRNCGALVDKDGADGCAAGGSHDTSTSGPYVVRTDPLSLNRETAYWRICTQCHALFELNSNDNQNKEKPCPKGGPHVPSGEFFVTFRTSAPYWRWCRRCETLAYSGGAASAPGCAAGGAHDFSSSAHYIPPRLEFDSVQALTIDLVEGSLYKVPGSAISFEVVLMTGDSATVRVITKRKTKGRIHR